ncbi:MAG: adenylate/guanylate cyclase domain-containing protein [Gaiellaceae bacterium]
MVRWTVALLLPLAGYFVLLAESDWDGHWENHKAHFWLVFGVAVVNAALGLAMSEAARRRGDARVFLVALVFLATGGFLALHALATPGVLLDGKNTGFVVATPVGLFVGACFAALSALDLDGKRGRSVVRHEGALRLGLLLLLVGWAIWSLSSWPPLDDPLPPADATGPLVGFAIAGGILYAFAAWRYIELYRRRPSYLLVTVTVAWVLLTEGLLAIAFARNWHATWWEWHVLMSIAFLLVAWAVRREYRRGGSIAEALGGLYLDETIGRVDAAYARALAELSGGQGDARTVAARFGLSPDQVPLLEQAAAQLRDVDRLYRPYLPTGLAERLREDPSAGDLGGEEREISVLFADLQGFTSFSERAAPADVIAMLNAYWAVTVPVVVREHGGVIERFAGDAVMVVFNAAGDQPDHATRAVAAAFAMQRATETARHGRDEWPRFRAGVNTGTAVVGNVGTQEQRSFAAIGDTTNLAARLQTAAEPGQVVVSRSTADALPDGTGLDPLGPLELKGKAAPVDAYVVGEF